MASTPPSSSGSFLPFLVLLSLMPLPTLAQQHLLVLKYHHGPLLKGNVSVNLVRLSLLPFSSFHRRRLPLLPHPPTPSSHSEQQVEIGRKGKEVTDLVRHKVMKRVIDLFQVEDDICENIEVHGAPSPVASEFVESKSSMICSATEVNETVGSKRLTRSAARSRQNSESCAVGLLTESSAVRRRCTCSSGLGRSGSMVAGKQGPESSLVPKAEQKPNLKQGSQRKEKLLSQDGCKTGRASEKCRENKVNGINNHGQGETENHSQKRKDARLSTLVVAEQRFSPRLRNLCQG